MIPEKDKRYLLYYEFGGNDYYDVGVYTGREFIDSDSKKIEYIFDVKGGSLSMSDKEIIKSIDNPHDGSTLDNFLLEERLKAWEKCADDLVDYAHEFVAHLSLWGKGYDRYDKDIKKAEDAIEEYLRLKNETA
jgi:hypothetical protein